jgi:hypothetical protein
MRHEEKKTKRKKKEEKCLVLLGRVPRKSANSANALSDYVV